MKKSLILCFSAALALVPISTFAALVSGTVKDNVDTTILIKSAKVLLFNGTTATDSTTTDSLGNYSLTTASSTGTRTEQVSATRYVTNTSTAFSVATAVVRPVKLVPVSISGTVRDTSQVSAGVAVVGAKVVLIIGTTRSDSATTSATGTYSILRVAPGIGSLQVSDSGYTTLSVPDTVAAASITKNIIFQPVTVSGTVRKASDSTVIANAKVYLIGVGVLLDSTTSNTSGNYTFFRVKPGAKTVKASATGFAAVTSASFTVAQVNITGRNIYLPLPAFIAGKVALASSNTPAANVLLTLRLGSDSSAILDSTRTNSAGAYLFTVATGVGNYWVDASSPGYATVSNGNIGVIVADTTQVNFGILGYPGSVSGSITSGDVLVNGAAITVRLDSATGPIASVFTATSGTYAFSSLPAGPVWITVSAAGYITVTNMVTVPNGAGTTANFILAVTPGSITGSLIYDVSPSFPQSIKNATMTLRQGSDTGAIVQTTTSNSNGVYTFSNVAPGTYWVTAATTVGTTTNGNIVVTTGASAVSNFTFAPTALYSVLSNSHGIRVIQTGDHLELNLDASSIARTLEVYDLSGVIHSTISVPANETHVVVSAAFVKGYFFQIK